MTLPTLPNPAHNPARAGVTEHRAHRALPPVGGRPVNGHGSEGTENGLTVPNGFCSSRKAAR